MKDILIKDDKTTVARKTLSAIIVMMLFTTLQVISILSPLPNVSAQSIDQRVEPVIVLGSDLGDFIGTSVDEIWVYAFVGGNWEQIPFQLDERNDANGSYFVDAVDGILDSNDEIVFMPFDAGEAVPATSWVLDTEGQRYEVTVTDPIDLSVKYVYIYSSSILTQTFTKDYVNYNPTSHVITATDYTIGFDDIKMGIMDEIRINTSIGGDNTDILDRMKYRLQVTIGIPFQFDEDDLDYTMAGYKDGPVRLIQQIGSGDFVNINYAYKSYAMATQEMNIGISPDWVRISLDFLSTATPMTYYDSNANDLTIDGVMDTPTSTTAPTWAEITGPAGTVVIPRDLAQVGGIPSLYYTDNSTSNDAPESEFGEYGDSGIYITNPPIGNPTTFLSFYFLPPNQGNVGSTYDTFTNNPLTTNAQAQYLDSSPLPEITDVSALPYPQEVEGFVNISANIVDNYELYGAWVDIRDPNDNPAGNFSMSYDSSTSRYYDNRAYNIVGTYQFTIWANDTSNNWNSSFGQFEIHDTTLPEISDVTSLPDPQEVEGLVDISAIIEDNYELNEVWINITDPNDNPVGNFSMSYDSNTNRYHNEQAFDIIGMYQFTIWANDTSSNWNSSFGQFEIHDTTLPEISDVTALPDPQEVDGYVNISAAVSDIVDVNSVRIEITDPNDNLVGNFSMSYDFLTNRYYDNRVYDIVGVYQFIIWASDTSDNWESESDQFTIQDTQPPMANAGLDQAVIVGTTVTFDGSASTDNVGIVDYTWTFTDGTLQTLYGSSPNYRFNNVENFEISLSVVDAADNKDTDTMWVNVTMVPDTTLPTITHTPITSGTVGEPLLIIAEITDNIEVTDASLFYRQSGETVYTEVAMTNTFDNEWKADIPSSAITTAGIEYYIFATDGVNNATQPTGDPYFVNVEGEEKGSVDYFWLLLMIILIAVIIMVILLIFLIKTKKEKRGRG